jgi:methyl-accepting chemotaxis protein
MSASPDTRRPPQGFYGHFLRLLAPGERLMVNLRLRSKLVLLGTLVSVPLLLLGTLSLLDLLRQQQVIQREAAGLRLVQPLLRVMPELQLQRRLLLASAGGASAEQTQALQRSRTVVAQAVAEVDSALAEQPSNRFETAWTPLRQRLLDTAAQSLGFSAQGELIGAVEHQVRLAADVSGMLLQSSATAHQLVDLLVYINPPLIESMAQASAVGAAALSTPGVSAAEIGQVLALGHTIVRLHAGMSERLEALGRQGNHSPGSAAPARMAVERLVQDLQANFSGDGAGADAARFRAISDEAVARVHALQRDMALRLDAHMDAMHTRLWLQLGGRVALMLTGLLVLAYLLSAFVVSFQRSMNRLHRGTAAIADGNLAYTLQVPGRDELAEIGAIVESMSVKLSGMVAEIRNSASMVNLTGQQVSDGSARLAGRTDEQASNLRGSMAAINELAAEVARNAEKARELDALTLRLAAQAEQGHTAMQETVLAMHQLQQAADRVAEVVRVIDDVAFQTGMLSLNAAIEASRAGEAGRGFAVVSSEVRQLAQRCAESAEEIRTLIGETGAQVQLSAEKLGAASTSLDAVVGGVRQVSGALRGISDSSTQQSEGLQQVTQTVGNLDEITRENAALVEQSSTASHALVTRADRLREAVSTMRLRQGSADEALALVERAVAHVQAVGREQAFVDFHDAEGPFIDRDLYIFAFDREGRYAACGAKPANVGQPYSVTPGLDAAFVQAIWAAAGQGGAWVQYTVVNPLTQVVMPKESWVVALDDETLLGCGVYRRVGAETAAKPRAAAWSRKGESSEAQVADALG